MATLQVTKQFSVTLESGKTVELDASTTVDNVGEAYGREMKIPFASEATVLLVGAIGAGTLTDIKFFAIQNLDTVNFITLSLKDTGGDTSYHVILPGKSLDIYDKRLDVNITGAAFASFSDIDTISAQADTGDVLVSFIAGESC